MNEEDILHHIDDELHAIAKHISLHRFLYPTNVEEQERIFVERAGKYNPQFTYNFPKEEAILDVIHRLQLLHQEFFVDKEYSLPMSTLLEEKTKENIQKAELLLAYIRQDYEKIAYYNKLLFGDFDDTLVERAKTIMLTYKEPDPALWGKNMTNQEIQSYVAAYIQRHGRTNIQIKIVPASIAKFMLTYRNDTCELIFSSRFETRAYLLEAHLIHELQVHYQRFARGLASGRKILTYGTAYYLADEEGLAEYEATSYLQTHYPEIHKQQLYTRYFLLHYGQGRSFETLGQYMKEQGIAKNRHAVFSMLLRIKQGLQDTAQGTILGRDKGYVEGLEKIKHRVAMGNDVKQLYIGKIKIEDIPIVA